MHKIEQTTTGAISVIRQNSVKCGNCSGCSIIAQALTTNCWNSLSTHSTTFSPGRRAASVASSGIPEQ